MCVTFPWMRRKMVLGDLADTVRLSSGNDDNKGEDDDDDEDDDDKSSLLSEGEKSKIKTEQQGQTRGGDSGGFEITRVKFR